MATSTLSAEAEKIAQNVSQLDVAEQWLLVERIISSISEEELTREDLMGLIQEREQILAQNPQPTYTWEEVLRGLKKAP
jgi:hypothetical protein